jgi:hypothetical protein
LGKLWDKSGAIELDNSGIPADGAIANFYVGNTTTPLAVYSDASESTVYPADVPADGNGRWPSVFIPFTESYDVKVTTEAGTQLYYFREIPNPDPVEASEDSVDAADLIQTGDIIFSPVDETRTGFVRCNGRTIGNASSGATERANADTEDLFTFLWNKIADAQAAVSTGRGASAAADFAANKTITLLDGRASFLGGLDTMGNTAASRFPSSVPTTSGDGETPGSVIGLNTHTLQITELAAHTHGVGTYATASNGAHTHSVSGTTGEAGNHNHGGATGIQSANHSHSYTLRSGTTGASIGADLSAWTGTTTASTTNESGNHTHSIETAADHSHSFSATSSSNGAHTHTLSGSSESIGGDTAHNNVSRALIGSFFQRL